MMPSDASAPFRILIVNTVALNTGDAAILMGAMRGLRRAFGDRVGITVADDHPDVARRLYPGIDFVAGFHAQRGEVRPRGPAKLRRSIRRRRITLAVRLLEHSPGLARRLLDADARVHLDRLRAADAVVSTGGTYFVEHYPIRGRAEELLAAQALGVPTYLYTQSIGPFHEPGNRRIMRRVLDGVDRVFVRDERSRGHLIDLDVSAERIEVRADAAFAIADSSSVSASAADADPGEPSTADRLRIAVSVRHWPHFRRRSPDEGQRAYRNAVADLVRHLHGLGAAVTFVSTCQGVPAYRTDDSRYARSLVDELLADVPDVRVDTSFRRPEQLVEHLRGFDLVVATRMHFAILALAAGVPVVPIAYEFKTTELFDGLGMGDLMTDIETITPDALERRVDDALERLDDLRARIRDIVPKLRRDASAPAMLIRERHDPAAVARTATSRGTDVSRPATDGGRPTITTDPEAR